MLYEDTFLTIYILVIAGIFGAVFGSFINCMAWRIANNESVLKGRSHCTACGHVLTGKDLIPIFSYIFLKGKCRYCGEKIHLRYVMTEIFMAAAFVLTFWRFDVTFLSLRIIVLLCILMALSLVDLETFTIPDRFIISAIVWWIVTIPLTGEPIVHQLKWGLIGGFSMAVALILLSVIFDKLTGKEGLGGGDIKLLFVAGLYLGPWVSLLNLILACVIGILFVIFTRQNKIPFGPAISSAFFISLLVGSDIVNWYLSLF